MKTKTQHIQLKPDTEELEEVKALIEDLAQALEKANDLLDQLASKKEIVVSVSFAKRD